MTERRISLIAITVTVLFWGLSFISTKVAVPVLPPMSLGAARFALAVVFLAFVKRSTAPEEKLALHDLPYLMGAGLMGVTAYFYFENTGLLFVSASEASIIIAAIPVMSMVVERAVEGISARRKPADGGRISPPGIAARRWAGAALSMLGVWLVAGVVAISGSVTGYLYMFGAAVSWVVYCFLTRPLFARRSRIYIVFWQSVFGFIGFLPFAVAESPRWGRPDLVVFLHVVYLGVFCSALGYWFYARALQSLGVATATVFVNLIPVITVAAAFVFLRERLAPVQWVGAAAVLAGVYLATWEGRRKRT